MASQAVPPFDYAGYARMLGLDAIVMQAPDDIVPGWEQALASRRPVVVHAHCDPEVPPLPPHITLKQARSFLASMIKGDPHRFRVIEQSAKDMWAGLR